MLNKAGKILSDIFGYEEFRPLQEEIIKRTLEKKDSLVIMPTGGGKSLCYQIPALLFEGITIVLSPLISLMKDQVEQLREVGVNAVCLNSSLSGEEYAENIHLLRCGKAKLLYIAPETLSQDRTINLLKELKIDCFTVDEAHCISEWGHDFRPDYRNIAEIKKQFPGSVCVAFTATATPRVREDIKKSLRLKNPKDFIASFNRENLFLEIIPKGNGKDQIKKLLTRYPNQSGIIYCFSRNQVDSLASELMEDGYSVKPYHAGLSDDERRRNQEMFIRDDIQIIVATVAFGMGINKSNVRFVIHHDLPKNIESYYQEIGRAGRDGLRAHCLLLFSYSDTMKLKYFINQKEALEKQIAIKHLNSMLDYAETGVCRRVPLLNYFGEDYETENCGMCDNCKGGDKNLVDVTIAAQKFLSCVKRTGELFGAHYITDVLRGSNGEKIITNRHNELSTYGIGKEYSKKQWVNLAFQFQREDLLAKDEFKGGLRLTEKAYHVLKGKMNINGRIIADAEPKKDIIITENYDKDLFAELRKLRKKLADKVHLPPFVIFSDKSLTEMSVIYPVNKAEFMKVNGVGNTKFERYGKLFISAVIEYCKKNGIKPNGKEIDDSSPFAVKEGGKRYESCGEKFNKGMTFSEIAAETKYKRSTIINHLFEYGEENKLQNPERLLEESLIPETEREEILNLFDKIGIDKGEEISSAIKKKIKPDEIRLLEIYYLAGIELKE